MLSLPFERFLGTCPLFFYFHSHASQAADIVSIVLLSLTKVEHTHGMSATSDDRSHSAIAAVGLFSNVWKIESLPVFAIPEI